MNLKIIFIVCATLSMQFQAHALQENIKVAKSKTSSFSLKKGLCYFLLLSNCVQANLGLNFTHENDAKALSDYSYIMEHRVTARTYGGACGTHNASHHIDYFYFRALDHCGSEGNSLVTAKCHPYSLNHDLAEEYISNTNDLINLCHMWDKTYDKLKSQVEAFSRALYEFRNYVKSLDSF